MSGFSPQVFAWFEGLERDNTKAYFTATRDFYEEEVRGGLESLLDDLRGEVGGDVMVRRQQRDLRFTPDKTPYKTRTYGHVGRLYVAISATGLYAGTGYYQLMRDQLDRYREAVADDVTGPPFEAAMAGAGLDIAGATLRTAPRGYPRDHPRIELLRRKQLIAGRALPAGGAISGEAAREHSLGVWRAAAPILAWLDEHVGPSTLAREEHPRRR